jgi:hypothetical protein
VARRVLKSIRDTGASYAERKADGSHVWPANQGNSAVGNDSGSVTELTVG